ncbi:MAG TPA: FecR family protein [Myxococcota bacterium]|nr:FecR family protein [Myxococcota bacterium]
MSKRRTIQALFALVICAVFIIGASRALSAGNQAGKITYMKGSVTAYRDGSWVKLNNGSPIFKGDMIRTGKKKSRVEIVLSDSSVIRLGKSSKVKISQALFSSGGKNFSAKLMRGQAYALVSKLTGSGSKFEVKTSNAVAGVRGTTFRIDSKTDKSTVVRVYTGAVAVSNAPIYAKPGKVKDASGKFQMPRQGVKPGGPGRVEVAGPHQVTKKEWEEFVAKAMQEVRVAANGKISAPVAFNSEQDAADEWVAWNKSRDQQRQE